MVFYCIALEALFSRGQGELAHQVAERAALFVGVPSARSLEVFRAVKQAYNLRSKIVHGDVLKSAKIEQLKEAARACDDILRSAEERLIEDQEAFDVLNGSDEDFKGYFLSLIFPSTR